MATVRLIGADRPPTLFHCTVLVGFWVATLLVFGPVDAAWWPARSAESRRHHAGSVDSVDENEPAAILPAVYDDHDPHDRRASSLSANDADSRSRKPNRHVHGRRRFPVSVVGDGTGVDYFQTCGRHEVCDRRTHFCDRIIDACLRCDDDCHSSRISGNVAATDECRVKCALWYDEQSRTTASTTKSRPTRTTRPTSTLTSTAEKNEDSLVVFFSIDSSTLSTSLLMVLCGAVSIAVLLLFILIVLVQRTCRRHSTDDLTRHGIQHTSKVPSPPLSSSFSTAAAASANMTLAKKTPLVPPYMLTSLPPSYDSSV